MFAPNATLEGRVGIFARERELAGYLVARALERVRMNEDRRVEGAEREELAREVAELPGIRCARRVDGRRGGREESVPTISGPFRRSATARAKKGLCRCLRQSPFATNTMWPFRAVMGANRVLRDGEMRVCAAREV